MSTFRILSVVAVTSAAFATACGQTVFSDDFEPGLGNWVNISATYPITLSSDHNIAPPGGSQSMCISNSGSRTYHNLGTEVSGPCRATWYIYDDTQTRIFGEVRGNTGDGWATGSLEGIYAAGKYTSVSLPGEAWDSTRYQGRLFNTATSVWFNLNAPGAPRRSPGWHRFDIRVLADRTTVNYYVDGILGRSFTGLADFSWDCVVFGLGASTVVGNAWVDGVSVTREPQTEPTVALIKAVRPSFSNLLPTINYQLQISPDMSTWTNHGSPFTATDTTMPYPQYWDVDEWSSLFFRLRVAP